MNPILLLITGNTMNAIDWILALFLSGFLLHWAIETLLDGLNLVRLLQPWREPPAELKGQIPLQALHTSQSYSRARLLLGLVRRPVMAGVTLLLLFSGVLPAWDQAAGYLDGVFYSLALSPWGIEPPIAPLHRGVIFLVGIFALLTTVSLPFALYNTFVIETRFGFNRSTLGRWALDRAKGMLVAAGIGVPFLYAVLWFMDASGAAWWLWVLILITAVQLAMVWLYPSLIAPLFNRFTPLPQGELRERLESLSRSAGFRTRGLFVMDASRRSSHSNAYFVGFGRPRIVLFDSLMDQLSDGQIAAVLAHEIGHFRLRHVLKRMAAGTLGLAAMLFALSLLIDWVPVYLAFGFDSPSNHAALALALLCGDAFTFWIGPLAAIFSRKHEYQADAFACQLADGSEDMKAALIRLNTENLANLRPHPWYSAYHYSHPTLFERLRALERFDRVAAGAPAPREEVLHPSGELG